MRQARTVFSFVFLVTMALMPAPDARAQSEVQSTGSLQVNLGPAEALASGARWRMGGGAWQLSGSVEAGLEPGMHAVDFSPAAGWFEPEILEVMVVGGTAAVATAEYQHLPAYYFRAVPPQFARHGQALRLIARSSDPDDPQSPAPGTVLAMRADPQPVGSITRHSGSGELRYEPDVEDRRDFTVTFTASTAAGPIVGSFLVTPVPALPPEDGVIHFQGQPVDPESTDYVQIREEHGAAPESFNSGEHITRRVSISGAWLVFEAGSTKMDLFDRFSGDEDLKELTLYAERITIRSPVVLPQTRLTIHARELRFEGQGSVDVTPHPPLTHQQAAAGDGADGISAAPMAINIERFYSDATKTVRLIGRGTRGQDPNLGAAGPDGPVAPGTETCGQYGGFPIVHDYCILPGGGTTDFCGTPDVYGATGISAGKPGDGGSGATLWSALDIARHADLAGGAAGRDGRVNAGGMPKCYQRVWTSHPRNGPCSSNGVGLMVGQQGLPSAATFGKAGPAGALRLIDDRGSWLHPILLESLLLFVKDQYLAGQLSAAQSRLADYAACVKALKGSLPTGDDVIADSVRDWSAAGVQGENNWYYGYHKYTVDRRGGGAGGIVAPLEPPYAFIEFSRPAHWTGTQWDLLNAAGGPWTEIGRETTHPNGSNSPPGQEQWTIRRWVSDRVVPVTLTWNARKTNLAGGNGVTGYLLLNGGKIDSATVAFDDSVGPTRSVEVNLGLGDSVDLALGPAGADGNRGDGGDGSANWLQVTARVEPRFAQLEEEIETLLYRIDSNLDYFGNPASWVPMLSFEANLAAFTQEIERAIPVLYLAYWIEAAAEKAVSTRQALVSAKEKAADDIDAALQAYEAAREEMPRLEVEGHELEERKDELDGRLRQLEAELLRRAEENVEERHKVPFWRRAVGILGAIAKVIPVAQPVLGGVGVGLDVISKFDPDHPTDSLKRLPGLLKTLSETDYTLCQKQTEEEEKEDDEDGDEDKQSSIERLKRCAKLLAPGAKEIRGILKSSTAPKSEIEAEVEKLRAQEPRFREITSQLEELNKEKQLFGERLAAAMQAITRFSTIVTLGLKTIDELDRNLDAVLDVIDHQALVSVAAMGQAARDRLLRYQYLMAKAYQYRIVKPYTGSFKLLELFDKLRDLAEFHDTDHLLTAQDFQDLKAVYLDELSRVADSILTDLNSRAPERSAPVSFQLSAQELAELNQTGKLVLHLGERSIFGRHQENLRIVALRVKDASRVLIDGAIGGTAALRLDFEHAGVSRIVNDGAPYVFTHYRTERSNPIRWGAVYDGIGGAWTQTRISAATESLIRFLLGLAAGDADGILLYSRPGALAEITISRELTSDTALEMTLERLVLELEYDYADESQPLRQLEVKVAGGLQPIITVDYEDENGRQDGRGSFTRRYKPVGSVRLEAPATHGVWQFDRWEDGADPDDGGEVGGGAAVLGTTPVLDVSLASDVIVRAVYSSSVEPVGGAFRRGDAVADGRVNISDPIKILAYLFTGGAPIECEDSADANDDGRMDISDAVTILNYLFTGTASIPAPGADACGIDPTADQLTCFTYDACEP